MAAFLAFVLCAAAVAAAPADRTEECAGEACSDDAAGLMQVKPHEQWRWQYGCGLAPCLPLSLTDVAKASIYSNFQNIVYYKGLLIPDPDKPIQAFSRMELRYADVIMLGIFRRVGGYRTALGLLAQQGVPMTVFLAQAQELAVTINAGFFPPTAFPQYAVPYLQGYPTKFALDTFSAQLLGYSVAGYLLQPKGDEWVLDLTESGSANNFMQRTALAQLQWAPQGILRCRGTFVAGASGPELKQIAIVKPSGGELTFEPSSGAHWDLAKRSLHLAAKYLEDFAFHTACHLYSAQVTAALQRALPRISMLDQVVDAHTLRSVATILEVYGLLHANHGSSLTGATYNLNVTEIEGVRDETAKTAQGFLTESLEEITGCASKGRFGLQCPLGWWAGGAATFVAPIRSFARELAKAVLRDKGSSYYLQLLEAQLRETGLLPKGAPSLGLRSVRGLQHFIGNLIFIQSVYHSGYWTGREYMSPLGPLLLNSLPLLPKLEDPATDDADAAINAAYPAPTPQQVNSASGLMATTTGQPQVPTLGQGPYYAKEESVQRAAEQFQRDLNEARETVPTLIPAGADFEPLAFYPEPTPTAPRPVGLYISQSTES